MARDDAEPNAYEYAGKGSPNASDNDEDTNVEPNASITKLLTTQGSRDSNESTNADAEDIGTMDTMEYILPTLRVRQEEGLLSQKDYDRIASLAESLLDVLAEADTGSAKQEAQETQEVQETRPADGSSSARPLDMEDGNRKILMGYGPDTLSQIADGVIAENQLQAKSTDAEDFAAMVLDATSPENFVLALEASGGLTTSDSNRNKVTIRLNDFRDENIKNTFIKLWILIGKGLNKTDDAYTIWKKIKDDMNDNSILQHKEVCKLLEPIFDAIDKVVAMSLLLVIQNYKSPKNATTIAALCAAAPTMRSVIMKNQPHGKLWKGRSKTKQLLDMTEQTKFTEDKGKLDDDIEQHRTSVKQLTQYPAMNFVKLNNLREMHAMLCSRSKSTGQPYDNVVEPINELDRQTTRQPHRDYVKVHELCQEYVTAARAAHGDEATIFSISLSSQKKLDEWRRTNNLPEIVPQDKSTTVLNVDDTPISEKKKEKPRSKWVELTEAQNAECRELNCCKRYNIQRVKGRSHEYAETFCSMRREKMREKTDCCKDRHLVIPALRQKLNLDPSDAGMKSVTKE